MLSLNLVIEFLFPKPSHKKKKQERPFRLLGIKIVTKVQMIIIVDIQNFYFWLLTISP